MRILGIGDGRYRFHAAGLRLRLGCTLERAGGIVLLLANSAPRMENRTVKTLLSSLSLWLALSASAFAGDMRLTIYDDGISCPGNCDSHVVMNTADNGTRHAYRPDSSRTNPAACRSGESCTICFGDADSSCMKVTYRGGGPRAGTFDFTPAFYRENCPRDDAPAALKAQCKALDDLATKNGYTTSINCIETPENAKCTAIISAAKAAQNVDIPKREACLRQGEAAYNKAQSDPSERRSNSCNYTLSAIGGSGEKHWRKLLPGACRPGTYVDQFGLDCCSADVRFAAQNHPECIGFFVKP